MVGDIWFRVGGGIGKSKVGMEEGLVPPLHATHSYTQANTHTHIHTQN